MAREALNVTRFEARLAGVGAGRVQPSCQHVVLGVQGRGADQSGRACRGGTGVTSGIRGSPHPGRSPEWRRRCHDVSQAGPQPADPEMATAWRPNSMISATQLGASSGIDRLWHIGSQGTGHRRGLGTRVVTDPRHRAALCRGPGDRGMPDGVRRTVEAGVLAVPEARHALVAPARHLAERSASRPPRWPASSRSAPAGRPHPRRPGTARARPIFPRSTPPSGAPLIAGDERLRVRP